MRGLNLHSTLLAATILACAGGLALAEAPDTEALQKLFVDEWHYSLAEDPLLATSVGVLGFNHQLPDPSIASEVRRNQRARAALETIEAISPDDLGQPDRVSYLMFRRQRRDAIKEHEFQSYLMPITARSGFHVSFPQLPKVTPFDTIEDYRNYIERLKRFEGYVLAYIGVMREGIEQGFTLPAPVLEGWQGTVDPHIVDDPTESLLYEPFESFPDRITEAERANARRFGKRWIAKSVIPAYREFRRFMEEEYVPAARKEIGASSLPNGRAFYEHRVRRFTTLDLTPQQVHDLGLSEVRRIREEMLAIVKDVGHEGTLAEFFNFLRTDPQFYVETPEELMQRVARVMKQMDGELPRLFGKLPRMPYGIRPVPDFIAPKTTTAYYERPAGDGSRAGYYYVNTYDLPSRPLYEVEALSLHEAVPGHHLQIALQQELEGLPDFRRFSGATAFVEGWALYSERLGLEVGFYEDPYSDFGRLTYEMWRACRLVVDTGIHYFDWSRRRAIDFMLENSGLTEHNIATEVDRYIAWPGQALAYKIGELKIRELRGEAETALGPEFDVRAFHDVVLGSGAVPLAILEDQVRRWIGSTEAPERGTSSEATGD